MSWEYLDANRIIKSLNKIDFKDNQMIIPREMKSFFKGQGERLAFIFKQREYPNYLEPEGDSLKLKWSKVLVGKLTEILEQKNNSHQNSVKILFEKKEEEINLYLMEDKKMPEFLNHSQKPDQEQMPAGLGEKLREWIEKYPNYYPRDFRFSFKEVIEEEIPAILENIKGVNKYQIRGFAGEDQWASIPWVGLRDISLAEGRLGLAYLLAKDINTLYLALIYQSEEAGLKTLSQKVAELRKDFLMEGFKTEQEEIYLEDPLLVGGVVYYLTYTNPLPDDQVLISDFEALFLLFDQIIKFFPPDEKKHQSIVGSWPAENSDSLEGVIENTDRLENNPAEEENEEAADKLSKYSAPLRIDKRPGMDEDFQSLADEKKFDGRKIDQIIDREKDDFLKMVFPPKRSSFDRIPNSFKMIFGKMADQGFYFPLSFIMNYYLALKAKPFILLKGPLGSGRTTFPRLFAQAIGANYENERYERILVGRDWQDEKSIFYRAGNSFLPGRLLKMIKKADLNPDKPYFLLLDEMDQARSTDVYRLLIEGVNGREQALLGSEDFNNNQPAFREYGNLIFPDNLYLIGSLNQFAIKKIAPGLVDGANIIEMPPVQIKVPLNAQAFIEEESWLNSHFKMKEMTVKLPQVIEKLMNYLADLQVLLKKYHCPMGYRQKNEILAYGINNGIEELFTEEEVIDYGLKQRILTIIENQNSACQSLYRELSLFCLQGKAFSQQERLMKLSTAVFCEIMEAWWSQDYFVFPLSGQELIKLLKHF